MKKTQIFTVVLAVALGFICLGFVTTKVHAETVSSGTFGNNLIWVLDSSGTLTISGTGDIPATSASQLAPWYSQQKQIKTIIIDNGITSIPEDAFVGYASLTKVTIGDTVASIGKSAFEDCRQLSDIKLPANLTAIAEDTFRLCYGLTEIVIPNGVTKIGSYAFYDCHYLTSITIPSTVTYVELGAFTSCNRLTNIYISDLVAWMNIAFDANATDRILDESWNVKTLYLNNEPVTALVIPDGVQEIAPCTFFGCNFTSVTIPESVTKIYQSAFAGCLNLTNVVIPDGVTQIGGFAFASCEKLTGVTIGEKVTSIGDGAFRNCAQLQQIVIPNSVTSVGKFAFENCTGLASATIGTGLAQIDVGMFKGCSSLTAITIPGNVSIIGEDAFAQCTQLASVTIGEGVMSIGPAAFWRCSSLNHISFPDGIATICREAFAECYALQDVVFGQGLQVIEQEAFYRCTGLVNVKFPDGLTTIQNHAFYGCSKFEMVILPASIKTIGPGAFYAVWHVLFKGTEDQWNSLYFDVTEADALNRKTVHFNCTGDELPFKVIAPTCTEIGYTAYTCSRCKEIRHNQLTDPLGHSYGAWYIAKEATLTSTGIERRDCKRCDKCETKDIPVKTHTDKNSDFICDVCGSKLCTNHTEQLLSGKNATCIQDGWTDGKKCANCGAILREQEVIAANGHSYGEWTQITSEGLEERACTVCGEKEQRQTVTSTPIPDSAPTEPGFSDKKDTDLIVIVLAVTAAVVVVGIVTTVLIKKQQ